MKQARIWGPVGLLVLVAGAWFSRDALARLCLHRLTGLTAEVRVQGWGRFEVQQLVCTNYQLAGTLVTAEISTLSVEYAPLSLLRRQLHIYDLTCEVRHLAVTRNKRIANGIGSSSRPSGVRVDVVHLKLDGTLQYDEQTLTGKLQATFRDVQDFDAIRGMFRSP